MKSKDQIKRSIERLQAIKDRIAKLRKELEEEQEQAEEKEQTTPQ